MRISFCLLSFFSFLLLFSSFSSFVLFFGLSDMISTGLCEPAKKERKKESLEKQTRFVLVLSSSHFVLILLFFIFLFSASLCFKKFE